MNNTSSNHQLTPKICWVAVAVLIHQQKILLIKQKNLGIWLAPGGHIDQGELPHITAQRECLEETGIEVKAVSPYPLPNASQSDNLPSPILTNLHWLSKENYQRRLQGLPFVKDISQRKIKACEQHLAFIYLVKPVAGVKYTQNLEETDGIGWFGIEQVDGLETTADAKAELRFFLNKFSNI